MASVKYRGAPLSPLNHFTWILFERYHAIDITVDSLIFKAKRPPNRIKCLAEYEAHRDAYLEERRSALPSISQLGVESQQTTALLTTQHSPRQQSIYLPEEELGRGGFGAVYKAVDVSTGVDYAAKVFHGGYWKKEVEILKGNSHALQYLHSQTPPIAHRDIKPENILVQSRTPFVIKLVDFGSQKATPPLKPSAEQINTPLPRFGSIVVTLP
ncbi:MAG: hypothetical protein Q9197_001589 [Variospora fuerteventurae]